MALRRAVIRVNNIGRTSAEIHRRLHDVTFAAATNIAERAAASMEGPKSGRFYRVPGTKGAVHQASAPGEAPAIETGLLHGSLFVGEVNDLTFIAGTNVEYAEHLELGTVNIEARPFLLPAAEVERAPFEQAIAAAVGGR